ncbi:MAG TPA: hypothetical protein VGF59_29075, partial [Bryobacteraceae bacterium]
MDFYQKYELIDALPVEGPTKTFRARQISTGRNVAVHLLLGGRTPQNEALLARLRAIPPASMAKLLEVGENEGTTYVVTVAPPYEGLPEWLTDQERAAAAVSDKEFTRVGTWKVPAMQPGGPPPAPAPAPPTAAAPPAAEPGEFTRMFQAGAKPAAEAPPAASQPASSGPGEF